MHDIDDELEQFEKKLISFQEEFAPSPEFTMRMAKRLQRHDVLLREARHENSSRSFWSFLGTRTYAAATAFIFVLFTGGVSTFAYTNDNVTNGNPLYPVKRGLEKIEETFAGNTPEAHAEFQVKMLGRRLAESRNLTLNGIVDESTTQEVSTVVDNGIQAIQAVDKSDYRDQLLDRVTTMLKNEEKEIYATAGVPLPAETIAPAVSVPVINAPVQPTMTIVNPNITPRVASPSTQPIVIYPLKNDGLADGKTPVERVRAERREPSSSDDVSVASTRSSSLATPTDSEATPQQDNVPTSLSARSDVMDALEKHSQHLRQIELRVTEVRRK